MLARVVVVLVGMVAAGGGAQAEDGPWICHADHSTAIWQDAASGAIQRVPVVVSAQRYTIRKPKSGREADLGIAWIITATGNDRAMPLCMEPIFNGALVCADIVQHFAFSPSRLTYSFMSSGDMVLRHELNRGAPSIMEAGRCLPL